MQSLLHYSISFCPFSSCKAFEVAESREEPIYTDNGLKYCKATFLAAEATVKFSETQLHCIR